MVCESGCEVNRMGERTLSAALVLVACAFALRILYAPIDLPYANDVIAEEVGVVAQHADGSSAGFE